MKVKYLDALNTVVGMLLRDESTQRTIQNLKTRIQQSKEPFVWSVVNIGPFQQNLPSNIKSVWIFVLKKDTPSIAHYHPNSIQHTVMIEGKGKVKIDDVGEDLRLFNPQNRESWYVIDKNLPHEFYPEGQEMVVISFHTCSSDELIEIKSDSGEHRLYYKSRNNTSNCSSTKWELRPYLKLGDIGYLTYLHGILYAKEYGYDQTFEAYIASGLSEFVQSFSPDKDRIWLAETNGQIIGSIAIVGHSRVEA
jgi:quercetin dioxygenase-like cupin family protein